MAREVREEFGIRWPEHRPSQMDEITWYSSEAVARGMLRAYRNPETMIFRDGTLSPAIEGTLVRRVWSVTEPEEVTG